MHNRRCVIGLCLLALALSGCAQPAESCPSSVPVGLSQAAEIAADGSLPFRFPLEESSIDESPYFGWFGASNDAPGSAREYHAAEDYLRPAGTPVYAIADGRVSFSGRMGGYGWLVIVDHPQANLYSLYGHLSPSRWRISSGTVERGQLIAYLGDSDENGGTARRPLEPHLHFGIRAGQRAGYPARGQWRWQAGWIAPCPQDLGWLQPSAVITNQDIPVGGFPQPEPGFLVRWGLEVLLVGVYAIGGVCTLIFAARTSRRLLLLLPGPVVIVAGIIFHRNGMLGTYVLLAIGILLAVSGIFLAIRQSRPAPGNRDQP